MPWPKMLSVGTVTVNKDGTVYVEGFEVEPPDDAYDEGTLVPLYAAQKPAEQEGATQDAARYRWLKSNHLQTGKDSWIRTGDDLEEAIDAAMKDDRLTSTKETSL